MKSDISEISLSEVRKSLKEGDSIGMLTYRGPAPKKGRQLMALFDCACGTKSKAITIRHVLRRMTRSCGCLRGVPLAARPVDGLPQVKVNKCISCGDHTPNRWRCRGCWDRMEFDDTSFPVHTVGLNFG